MVFIGGIKLDNKSGPVKTGPTGVVDTPLTIMELKVYWLRNQWKFDTVGVLDPQMIQEDLLSEAPL